MESAYSLSDVVNRTGAKRRALQLWADGGIIKSTKDTDRAGTGVHRRFPEAEVRIAALLVPLANMGTPIGILRRFAQEIRLAFHYGFTRIIPKHPLEQRISAIGRGLVRASEGSGENYMSFAFSTDKIWIDVKTDEDGPVCINPRADFAQSDIPREALFVVLDLTRLLRSLLV